MFVNSTVKELLSFVTNHKKVTISNPTHIQLIHDDIVVREVDVMIDGILDNI